MYRTWIPLFHIKKINQKYYLKFKIDKLTNVYTTTYINLTQQGGSETRIAPQNWSHPVDRVWPFISLCQSAVCIGVDKPPRWDRSWANGCSQEKKGTASAANTQGIWGEVYQKGYGTMMRPKSINSSMHS